MKNNSLYFWGSLTLLLAVALGAFGAHGLKNMLEPKYLATFETGVRYQFYHGFALLFLALGASYFEDVKLYKIGKWFLVGLLLFSLNCYLYAVTGIKAFAMIVPFGGLSFIIGWLFLTIYFFKRNA
jgi:uncharacterized membrane protein YgdD (TMEM256/DUF423 family)